VATRKQKKEDVIVIPSVEQSSEALVPASPVATPMPVHSGEEMSLALEAYQQLQKALDRKMPEAILMIKGKPFRTKKYWLTISRAFNLSVGSIQDSEKRVVTEDGDWGYSVVYRAIAPGGAYADGDGAVMVSEKFGDSGTVHNVRSHAHTRARNRAISNLCGFGEVSADEINEDNGIPARQRTPIEVVARKAAESRLVEKKVKKAKTNRKSTLPPGLVSTDLTGEPEHVTEVTFKRDLGNKKLYHVLTNHRKYTCIEEEPRVMAEGALETEQRVEMVWEPKETKKQPGKKQGTFNALNEVNYINDPAPDPVTKEVADSVDVDVKQADVLTLDEIPF
jgi:hypothetical protein